MKNLWIIAALLLLSACAMNAQEKQVRIGVLGLFHTREVVISSLTGKPLDCATGEERWPMREPLRLVLAGTVRMHEGGRHTAAGAFPCEPGPGGPAEFTVHIPGQN